MALLLDDMDGVKFRDRGTTWMAELRGGDPKEYLVEFLYSDPKTKGKFTEDHVNNWQENYNNDQRISTYGQLAKFLTALRHVYGVFTEKETTYTKNKILEGLTYGEVMGMPQKIEHNDGAIHVARELKKRGVKQVLFSKSNGLLVAAETRFLGYDQGEGVDVGLKIGNDPHVWLYSHIDKFYRVALEAGQGNTDSWQVKAHDQVFWEAVLTGDTEEHFEKINRIICYLGQNKINPFSEIVVAIDDTDVDMLAQLRVLGVNSIGFFNEADPILKRDKHLKALKDADLPVLMNDLTPLIEIVEDPRAIERYCK